MRGSGVCNSEMLDVLMNWAVVVPWIFGGCCSNVSYHMIMLIRSMAKSVEVYALEAIIKYIELTTAHICSACANAEL